MTTVVPIRQAKGQAISMQKVLLLIGLTVLAGAAACGSPPPTLTPPVQGYKFEIRAPDGGTTTGTGESFIVQSGGRSVEMKNGALAINGESFGDVPDGAQIFVNETGQVFVNGVERQAVGGQ